jgi:serine/threonine protein kinase
LNSNFRLFGIVKENDDVMMVVEFVGLGSLLSYLNTNQSNIDLIALAKMSLDLTAALDYLESERILHRDLACRNLLLKRDEEGFKVKLSDFGLAYKLQLGETESPPLASIPVINLRNN